jgi:hypothetical protein
MTFYLSIILDLENFFHWYILQSWKLTRPQIQLRPHHFSYLLQAFEETPTHMSIKINRLEEGHNSYPLVCRRPAESVSLPHDKLKTRLKETIHKAFSHRSDGSKFVVLGYNSTFFQTKFKKVKISQYFCCPSFTADRIFVRWIDNSFVEQVDDPARYLSLYGVLLRGTSDQYAGVPHR